MKSMTGYGVTIVKGIFGELTIEMKAVNHRFFDSYFKLPHSLLTIEDRLRQEMKKHISRGKIDVSFHFNDEADKKKVLQLDENLLDQYISAAKVIESKLKQETKVDLTRLLTDQKIVSVEEVNEEFQIDEEEILAGFNQALQSFNQMRENEGRFLLLDMRKRLDQLLQCCKEVEKLAPGLVERYRERMETRIQAFLTGELEIDEARLLTEIAIFAEKVDISEELVRLQAHISQYELYLKMAEPIGRRLDFLIQEMNREVNTIGSKAADTSVRQHVVEMKGMLEKLKEQVQNVE
ncbi:YicC/YloC family endoribonuclease [Halalkalibacter akibai]|uniref:Protein YicC n=1 Tax=Halalkalibacter akibai (strain ATCC 43226 / DSM 21942 / CIP 109018 / JCM 9157 / 1139) TaxID=1236973 RepID=W4QQG8_HALA3|nr:YicC/YloC family endoribonuclease [Halalkalibacter akibai]GAE33893.1 protein YicC [Halalkalibacter akibai JCM 9157]